MNALIKILLISLTLHTTTYAISDLENKLNPTRGLAHIIQNKSEKNNIESLYVAKNMPAIQMVQHQNSLRPLVEIEFIFSGQDGFLYLAPSSDQNQLVPLVYKSKSKTYSIPVFLNNTENELHLVYKNDKKTISEEKILVIAPDAREFEILNPWETVRFNLGGALFKYEQSGYDHLYSWNGLLGIDYTQNTPYPQFKIPFRLEYLGPTVKSNQANYSPQLISTSAALQFLIPQSFNDKIDISGQLNGNYFHLFSNGAPYGFQNFVVFGLGMNAHYVLNDNSDYILNFKLHLPSTDHSLIGKEFEITRGELMNNKAKIDYGLRYLSLNLKPDPFTKVHTEYVGLVVKLSL